MHTTNSLETRANAPAAIPHRLYFASTAPSPLNLPCERTLDMIARLAVPARTATSVASPLDGTGPRDIFTTPHFCTISRLPWLCEALLVMPKAEQHDPTQSLVVWMQVGDALKGNNMAHGLLRVVFHRFRVNFWFQICDPGSGPGHFSRADGTDRRRFPPRKHARTHSSDPMRDAGLGRIVGLKAALNIGPRAEMSHAAFPPLAYSRIRIKLLGRG